MIGLRPGESRQIGLRLPVAVVVIIVDPMPEGLTRRRTLAGQDDAVPVGVDFQRGGDDAEVTDAILQPAAALRQEGDRQRTPVVFGREGEGHPCRPLPEIDLRGRPPLSDDLAVIAPDRDHVMLPEPERILGELMVPEQEVGAGGEVGTLHLHGEVRHPAREVVIAQAQRAFGRGRRRSRSRGGEPVGKFESPQPLGAQGGRSPSADGRHQAGLIRRVAGIRAMEEFGEVVPSVVVRVGMERVGAELGFKFVVQPILIAVVDGRGRRGRTDPEGGRRGRREQARQQGEEA